MAAQSRLPKSEGMLASRGWNYTFLEGIQEIYEFSSS